VENFQLREYNQKAEALNQRIESYEKKADAPSSQRVFIRSKPFLCVDLLSIF